MPVKRFWLLSANIDRIEAHRAIRQLTIAASAQSSAANDCREAMLAEIGTVATGSAEKDEAGLSMLKKMSSQ